ncbi:MAG: NAD-dependent epimerase/dehydratase family protein [Rhodospirillales bacterium]|nr:NAD-dependent epimerase/dehydratase family protein [Rhodospirillales bacterium]
MARILVTGGAGFIGSHLLEALCAAGDEVRVLDDLSTGRRANLPAGVALIEGDVADPHTVAGAMAGVDACYHLAAIASVERGVQDWLGTHRANLTGAITVFDAARARPGLRARPVPVVYASSAAVYGDAADLPITEATPPRPLSAYGADKLGCELHARVASHVHGVPAVGLRFFNVYGPRQDPRSPYSGVISIFCERLLAGAPVTIYGDGGQSRDFIYVGDIVAGLRGAMARAMAGAALAGEVFNLCTGVATRIDALAATIAHLCGGAADIRHAPARSGEIRDSVGARAAAAAAIGLPRPTALAEGLSETLSWMRAAV